MLIGDLLSCRSRLARVGTLEAQISPLEAQIDVGSGTVETRRLDLWLGRLSLFLLFGLWLGR